MNRLQSFIEHLRTLDDSAKRTWVFILSGVTMALVLILWVSYLNATFVTVPTSLLQEEQAVALSKQAQITDSHSLLANFKRNASQIYENLKTRIFGITNKGNEIDIDK